MSFLVAMLLAAAILMTTPPPEADRLAAVGRPQGQRRIAPSRPWTKRRARVAGPDVALALAEAIAPALDAGLSPAAALAHAAAELAAGDPATAEPVPDHLAHEPAAGRLLTGAGPGAALGRWAVEVQAAARAGEPVSELLLRGAGALRSPELALLAEAWSLTEATGGPLADAARTTAGLIRAATAQRRRLTAAVAGARSTMNLLTVLPLGGPLLAMALGVDPRALYLGSPLCTACLGLGVLLALLGRAWVRRLVSRAVEGPVVA